MTKVFPHCWQAPPPRNSRPFQLSRGLGGSWGRAASLSPTLVPSVLITRHTMSGRRNRAESRNVAAFNALLAPDEDPAPSSASRRRRSHSGGGGRGRPDRGRPIQLREQQQEGGGLRQLQELFGDAFPLDVIADVYNACSSTEEAIDALLSLSGASGARAEGGHTPAAPPADPAATGGRQQCRSWGLCLPACPTPAAQAGTFLSGCCLPPRRSCAVSVFLRGAGTAATELAATPI